MSGDPIFLSSDPPDSDSDSISITSTVQSEQDPDQIYLCERILARKLDPRTRRPVYLVKWEGYPMERCTWEPPEMFESSRTIENFERRYRRRERRRKGLGPTESETEDIAKREERRKVRREKEARGEVVEDDTEEESSEDEEFDWRAWDKEQERLAMEKEERQRRRRAKRERIEAKKARVFMEKGKRRVSARQEGRKERRGKNAAERLEGFVVDDDEVEYSSSDDGMFDDTETEDEDEEEEGEMRSGGRRRRKSTKAGESMGRKRSPPATKERKVPKKRPLAVLKSPPRPTKVQRKEGQADAAGKKRQSDTGMLGRKEAGAANKPTATPRQEKQPQAAVNGKKPPSSAKPKTPVTNTGTVSTSRPPSAQNAASTNLPKGLPPNKKKAPVVARAKKQSNQLPNAHGPRTYDKLSIQYRAQRRSNMEPEPDRAALELIRPGEKQMSNSLIFNKRPENRPAPPQAQQAPQPPQVPPAPMTPMAPVVPTMTAGSLIQELTEKHLKAQEERAAAEQAARDRMAEVQRKTVEARAKAQEMVQAAGRDKSPHRVTFQEPERRKPSPKVTFQEPVREPEPEKRKRSPPPGIPPPLPSVMGHVGSPPRKRVAFQEPDPKGVAFPEPSLEYDPMMLDELVPPPPRPMGTEMVDVRPSAPAGKLTFMCELVYGPGDVSAGRVGFVGFGSEFVRFLEKEGVEVMRIAHSLENWYLAQIFVPEVGVPLEYADLQGDMNQLEPVEHTLTSFNGAGVIATGQFTIMIYLARNSTLTKAFKSPGVSSGVMYRAVAYPPLDLPKSSPTPSLVPEPTLKDYASQLFVATRKVDIQEYLPRKNKDGRPRRMETIIIAPHFAVRESFDLRLTLERLNIHISEAAKTIPKITKDHDPMYLNIFVHSHYRDKLHLIPEFRGLHFATLKSNRCTYTFFGTHLTYDPETSMPVLKHDWEKFWRWGTLILMTPAYILSHEHALALVLKYTRLKAATTALCIPDFLFQRVTDTILSQSAAALDPKTNQPNELGRKNNTILKNLFELEDDFHDRAKRERGYQMIQLPPRAEMHNEFEALLGELTRVSNEQAAEFRRFVVCRDPEMDREGKGQVRGRLELMDTKEVERRLGVTMGEKRLGSGVGERSGSRGGHRGQGNQGQAVQGRPGTPGQQGQLGHPLPSRPPSAHQQQRTG